MPIINIFWENFSSNSSSKTLISIDSNNLYGSEPLHYGEFDWVEKNIDILCIPNDTPEGYIFEVDIEYRIE